MQKQIDFINAMLDDISIYQEISKQEAFPILLNWIAFHVGVDPGMCMESLKINTYKALSEYDLSILREEYNNHLGLVYYTLFPSLNNHIYPTLDQINKSLIKLANKPRKEFPYVLYIANSGTGNLILHANKILNNNSVFFTNETDLNAYRIQLILAKLFDINLYIVNKEIHSRIGPDSLVWENANTWIPNKVLAKL